MNNKLITKAVLILSGLALTLSAFTACVDDDAFANVEGNVAELESTVSDNAAQLTQIESELQTLANSIKATADAAATQAALEDAIAALEAADDTKAASSALATLKTALEASLQANADADAATKTAIETAIAAVKATADAAATAADLEAAKTAAQTAFEAADAVLDQKIADLEEAFGLLNETVGTFNTELGANISAVLESLCADVQALKNAQTVSAFVVGYNYATQVLAGEIPQYEDYSLDAFRATVKLIETRQTWYDEDVFNAFLDKKDTVEFFLTRATSLEAVIELIDSFNAYVDAMPTLTMLLDDALTEIEDNKAVTEDPECYAIAADILAAIDAVNNNEDPADNISTTSNEFRGLMERYNTIVAAQENIAAAIEASEEVRDAIIALDEACDPFFLLNRNEIQLEVANDAYTAFEEAYFSNDDYLALYDEEIFAMTLVIGEEECEIYNGYVARYEELMAADAIKPEIPADLEAVVYDFFNEFEPARPLFNQVDTITEFALAVEAWATDIEPENVSVMYTGDPAAMDLEVILAYAEAMANIYNEYEVEALVADIQALTPVYSDFEAAADCREALNDLKAAIEAVEAYAETDGNFIAMVGEDTLAGFAEIEEIMAELDAYNTVIEGIIAEMEALEVGYQDYPIITGFYAAIVEASEGIVDIPAEGAEDIDPNYTLITKPAVDLYNELVAEYKGLTALVAEVYVALQEVTELDLTLADGNTVWAGYNKYMGLALNLGVTNTDIELTIFIDEEPTVVNLKNILTEWYNLAENFEIKCEAAAAEAITINANIVALGNATDLNNYDAIMAVVAEYEAWATTYLGAADADITAVQNIKKLNSDEIYAFVTTANYNTLMDKATIAEDTAVASEEAFAIVDDLFAVAEEWNIHSAADFTAADAAYVAYLNTYYNGAIVNRDLNNERAEYTTYTTAKDAFNTALAAAQADRAAIDALIDALPAIEAIYNGTVTTDAAAAAAQTAFDAIAAYKIAYGCDIVTCTEGWDALAAADYVTLNAVAKYAAFVAAYNTAVAENGIAADNATWNGLYNGIYNTLTNATTLGQVEDVIGQADYELARLIELI